MILDRLRQMLETEEAGVRLTVVEGDGVGWTALLDHTGEVVAGELAGLPVAVVADGLELLDRELAATVDYSEVAVFFDPVIPPPVMTIFGAVHAAQALATIAPTLGYRVVVSDARPAFATPERFPTASRLLVGWPDAIADELVLDRRGFVVILSHDSRFEDPLWPLVLPSPVRYIGAMGSAKTAERRRERLLHLGFTPDQVARIHGPIGLDIGAGDPAELAVAVLAEITGVRHRAGTEPRLHGAIRRLAKI